MGERGYLAVKDYWNWDAVVQRMLAELPARAEHAERSPRPT
jgi:hypothetical protein